MIKAPQLTLFCSIFLMMAECLVSQHLKTQAQSPVQGFDCIATRSELQTSPCSGTAIPSHLGSPLLTNIKNLEKKHLYGQEIESIKAAKTKAKLGDANTAQVADPSTPYSSLSLGVNFQGNVFNGGAPPDNTIAISNDGKIVSVINCNVAYYNSNGNQLWTGSFWELFNDPALTEIIYDPIVKYDSQADRFVMIAVHGFSAAKSRLILSFSKSNNPLDGWWTYKLSGNPLNNGCWLDYPKLGISNNEIFVTGNLYNDLTGFAQSVIYQIGKSNGFAGTNLNWILWSNIAGAPSNMTPASYGQQGNYGPGLYFVNQSPGIGNAVDLYEITQDLSANPQLTRKTIFKNDYEPSGYALQSGTSVELITGDCRILDAFYLDDIIHYVFQSDYQNTNYTGINYNRLNVNTLTNLSYTFGQFGFDCAYPSLASYAISPTDKSVIFCYLRSGTTIFPETRAVIFDNNQTWSSSMLIKSGNNYVDAFAFDNTVRWGDYTGIAYKYNPASPEVWLSGCFGSTQSLSNTTYRCFNTWIAQIGSQPSNLEDADPESTTQTSVFPNPTLDLFSVEFGLARSATVDIHIQDLYGKTILNLFSGSLKKGKNLLTFNRAALNKGVYILHIQSDNTTLHTEKLVLE